MFDSKEISKRALIRAFESKVRQKRYKIKSSLAGMCVTVLIIATVMAITVLRVSDRPANDEEIEPNDIPLVRFQFPADTTDDETNSPPKSFGGCPCICGTTLSENCSHCECSNRINCFYIDP